MHAVCWGANLYPITIGLKLPTIFSNSPQNSFKSAIEVDLANGRAEALIFTGLAGG